MKYLTGEQIAEVFMINLPLKNVYVTQPFGANSVSFYKELGMSGHNGQDFRAKSDEVLSVFNGKVVKAVENAGYGVYVVVETDPFIVQGQKLKLQALYGHLAWFRVNEGQCVSEGQKIGLSDNTGKYTTGEHLHFGIRPLYEKKEGIWLTEENGYLGYIDPQPLFKYPYFFEAPVVRRYGQTRTWGKFLEEKKMAVNPWLRNKLKRSPMASEINAFVYGNWSYEEVINPAMYTIWSTRTKPEYLKIIKHETNA